MPKTTAHRSPRTVAVYDFIHSELSAGRPWPSNETITDHMGWLEASQAGEALKRLQNWGWVKRTPRAKNDTRPDFALRRHAYEIVPEAERLQSA